METTADAIMDALDGWEEDGRVHDAYVYVVNALGLDPDLSVEELRRRLTLGDELAHRP